MAENSPLSLSSADLLATFSPDMISWGESCRWMISRLHGTATRCPQCSAEIVDETRLHRFYNFEQIRCPSCGKKYTASTGTCIANSKLDPREIYTLMLLLALHIPTSQIAQIIRVDRETVRSWRDKISPVALAD